MHRLLAGFLLLQLLACAGPAPIHRYTLHGAPPDFAGAPFPLAGGLGVGPIELPESWRAREIITWDGGNGIVADSRHLWAGDPKLAISRVLAVNLGQQLQLQDVWAHPWDARTRPQQQILLVVESFGGPLGGVVEMKVKWRLTADQGTRILATERQEFSAATANDSHAAYVTAINQLINELSVALGQSIRSNF